MTQTIRGPDGQMHEFPDAYTDAQINSAMHQAYTAMANPYGRVPLGLGSALVGGAIGGLGLPGDLDQLGNELLPKFMTKPLIPIDPASALSGGAFGLVEGAEQLANRAMGRNPKNSAPGTLFPTASELLAPTNALGLTNNPHLAPQTHLESYGQAIAGGLGSAIPLIAAGAADLPAVAARLFSRQAIPTYVAGMAGGAGAEAGHELAPNSTALPLAGAMLFGTGAAGAAETIESGLRARSLLRAAREAEEAKTNAATEQFYGKRMNTQAREKAIADAKAAFDLTKAQAFATLDHFSLEPFASKLGSAKTFQDAGNHLQVSARDWLAGDMKDQLEGIWKPLNDAMPEDASGPPTNYQRRLGEINNPSGVFSTSSQIIRPPGPLRLERALKGAMGALELQGKDSSEIPWSNYHAYRGDVGEMMSTPQAVKDVGATNASSLYGAISQDMREIANKHGLGPAFETANLLSHRLYQIAGGPISKLVSGIRPDVISELPPESVAAKLLQGAQKGGSDLAALRQVIPGAVDNLAAVALRQDLWSKLSDEAKQALIPDTLKRVEVEKALDARAVAQGAKNERLAGASEEQRQANAAARAEFARKQFELSEKVRNAHIAAVAAKQALLPADTRVGGYLPHILGTGESIVGGLGGGALGTLFGRALQWPGDELVHEAMGKLAGVAIPWAWRGAKAAIKHPGKLRGPLAATMAGTNQLQPEPPD